MITIYLMILMTKIVTIAMINIRTLITIASLVLKISWEGFLLLVMQIYDLQGKNWFRELIKL